MVDGGVQPLQTRFKIKPGWNFFGYKWQIYNPVHEMG